MNSGGNNLAEVGQSLVVLGNGYATRCISTQNIEAGGIHVGGSVSCEIELASKIIRHAETRLARAVSLFI